MSEQFHAFDAPLVDLNGASIMVTGGTGSFGKAFIAEVLRRYTPRRLIIFSRDELKQYEMSQLFPMERHPCLRYFIGDVRDRDRLEMAMRDVEYVIHAAAMKQVTTAEYNPFECIQTNVYGAENVAHAAIRCGVRRVLALSTDKAANPINLYGSSKLAADKIFCAANHLSGTDGCRFSVVRYGNVLGSRGSLVPLIRRLVAEEADHIPITHPDMTRFWITISQAVTFVLSSMELMMGGEIWVPKIPSMKVVDLVSHLAPHMEQRVVGIRPGEKLHEVLVPADEALRTVELADRYAVLPQVNLWTDLPPLDGSRPVDSAFTYASNRNSLWLDGADLDRLMASDRHARHA